MPPAEGHRKIACQLCRRRKSACDGKQPCGHCKTKGVTCEYPTRHNPTGIRTGYVAQLEQRLALVEDRLADVEQRSLPPFSHVIRSPSISNIDAFVHDQHVTADAASIPLAAASADDSLTVRPGWSSHGQPLDSTSFPLHPLQNNEATQTHGQPTKASLHSISHSLLAELCTIWFERHHPWFPILHRASLLQSAQTCQSIQDSPRSLLLQSILLLALKDSTSAQLYEQWHEELVTNVTFGMLKSSSLDGLQAGLLLSNHLYGEGSLDAAGHMISICCRISDSLALHKVADRRDYYPTSPIANAGESAASAIDREERIRAYWMSRMLDSICNIGSSHAVTRTTAPTDAVMPCSESLWSLSESTDNSELWSSNRPPHSSAFAMCIMLATSELSNVHSFIDTSAKVDMRNLQDREQWQTNAQGHDERLTEWRDEFVAAVYRLINAEYAQHSRPEMDPYIVLTNCVLNTAVLTLLQRRAPCPTNNEMTDAESNPSPQSAVSASELSWAFASHRCIYACENTAFKVRHMQEYELQNCSPHLVVSIFAAARFYIVHSKAVDADVPRNLHSLAFALYVCGGRWVLARRCEVVIRTAVAEYRTPIGESEVPRCFYDLKMATVEVLGRLVRWAEGRPGTGR